MYPDAHVQVAWYLIAQRPSCVTAMFSCFAIFGALVPFSLTVRQGWCGSCGTSERCTSGTTLEARTGQDHGWQALPCNWPVPGVCAGKWAIWRRRAGQIYLRTIPPPSTGLFPFYPSSNKHTLETIKSTTVLTATTTYFSKEI